MATIHRAPPPDRTALEAFGLPQYQVEALALMCERKSFRGARVLEVGGHDLPSELKFDTLGAHSWFSVDLPGHGSGEYQNYHPLDSSDEFGVARLEQITPAIFEKRSCYIIGDVARLPHWFQNHFNYIISITAFEHLATFPVALNKMYRALAPGGCLLSYYGPIWSCFCGHHYWLNDELNFNKLGAIGPWDHLLASQPELYEKLRNAGIAEELAALAVNQIFNSSMVNRLFYEDYERYLAKSSFLGFSIRPYGVRPVSPEMLAALQRRYPSYSRFDAYGIFLDAWKAVQHSK